MRYLLFFIITGAGITQCVSNAVAAPKAKTVKSSSSARVNARIEALTRKEAAQVELQLKKRALVEAALERRQLEKSQLEQQLLNEIESEQSRQLQGDEPIEVDGE